MARDIPMQDADAADEERRQYALESTEELDEKYPNRPHNHSKTLPFHDLFLSLFNPLNDNKKRPSGPVQARRKQGPHGPANLTPHELRRNIIERFISRWRKEVGNDFYPALRLIVPEKDRDRAMYGLKEKAIAKILIKVLGVSRGTADAEAMMNWKLPGQTGQVAMAGDFAGRCYEVLKKRPMRTEVGNFTIGEVNEKLNRLSSLSKEEDQVPLFRDFYEHMNPEELMWLIRVILRQMKVGATEKTFFDIWHPDAENLFNVSSSLRRVCWELYDPNIRLDGDDAGIALMQCFQPQLAQFQEHTFQKVVSKMSPEEDDDEFWIEEKLDGERMQLHMVEDASLPGGRRFNFWSRKAKDYTYLYGNGLEDHNSALTRHLKDAFDERVRNIILDGEMITWSMEQDAIVPFGTLKTAALSEQKNPFGTGNRPVFRVFDCLYLNDQPLTKFTLRARYEALQKSVKAVERRLEIHDHVTANSAAEIETQLRQVVAEASEGLVIKNPRSMYRLNSRNDDWVKVKPEYMSEFGEELDCVIVGGYYGTGHRGGNLSSFMCGLRVDDPKQDPMLHYSFFKVGGGFTANDYADIRHRTEGKWKVWDSKKPPPFLELAGGDRQFEKPDVWIRPDESVVVSVKAASVSTTDQFRMGITLRFPRFKRLRTDKDWQSALTVQGFIDLKNSAEQEQKDKKMELNASRKQRMARSRKKPLIVAGTNERVETPYGGPQTKVFEGLTFHVLTDALQPSKKNKVELESVIQANGGKILANHQSPETICIGDKKPVAVASIIKRGDRTIVRPSWLFDCIAQGHADVGRRNYILPYEPDHLLFGTENDDFLSITNVDEFGDSYARDATANDLKKLFKSMPKAEKTTQAPLFLDQMEERGLDFSDLPGWMFRGTTVFFDAPEADENSQTLVGAPKQQGIDTMLAANFVRFGTGRIASHLDDESLTHVIVGTDRSRLKDIRNSISQKKRIPRVVTLDWVLQSWTEKTMLDEEQFTPR